MGSYESTSAWSKDAKIWNCLSSFIAKSRCLQCGADSDWICTFTGISEHSKTVVRVGACARFLRLLWKHLCKLGGLKDNRWSLTPSSEGYRSKIRVWAGLIPSEGWGRVCFMPLPSCLCPRAFSLGLLCLGMSASAPTFPLSLRTPAILDWTHPNDLTFTLLDLQRPYLFLNKMVFWGTMG